MTILLCFCCDAVRFSKNISTKVLFYFFQSLHVKEPFIVVSMDTLRCVTRTFTSSTFPYSNLPILLSSINIAHYHPHPPPPFTHPNPFHSYAPTFICHFIPSRFTPRSVTIDCILNLEKISLRYHNKRRCHFYWRA